MNQRDPIVEALPNYVVGGELGRGGWGMVLSARHRQLDRDVAVKQLPRHFAEDSAIRARFRVEARLLASLDHPHIVPVYDYVEQAGLCLLVMELLPGGTVWSRFKDGGFTAPSSVAVVLACLSGLQTAHDHNVLHRDIKPENLMFSASGTLKVTDFGIAKVVGGDETLVTKAGDVLGTPAYIAPEQARGGTLTPATDVYAVATMLYELLCGQLPFTDDADALALIFKHAFEEPEPLSEKAPAIPEELANVVMSGLATDPDERPSSAEEFGLELAEACTAAWGPGWLAGATTPVMGASSVVAVTERASALTAPRTEGIQGPAITGRSHSQAPSPQTVAGPPPASPVLPGVALRAHETRLENVDVSPTELVPLKDVVKAPPSAARFFLSAALLGVVALVVALVGPGGPAHGGTLSRGALRVAGVDPASGSTIALDLSKPVPVTVSNGEGADEVELSGSVLGQQVASGSAAITPGTGDQVVGVNLGGRYFVGGSFTGRVELLKNGQELSEWSFPARTSQSGLLSVPAGVTLVLLLFVIAYGESLLRSLRRTSRGVGALVGLTVIGAFCGLDFAGIAWVLARTVPGVASVVVCALIGAGAGLAAGLGGLRTGRRRRFRRVQAREARSGSAAA